MLIQGT